MRFLSRWRAAALPVLLAWMLAPAFAQVPLTAVPAASETSASADATTAPAEATVAELRARFNKIPVAAENEEDLRSLLAEVRAVGALATAFVDSRTALLTDLNARLGELGNAPSAPGATEDRDITRQRAALLKQRNTLDADVRLAKLLVIDVEQRGAELLKQRRKRFEAELTERAASPLGRDFWRDIHTAWPDDLARLQTLGAEFQGGLRALGQPAHGNAVLLSLGAALLLIVLGHWLAERGLVRLAARVLPPGRLRRSMLVIALVSASVTLVGLAVQWLNGVLDAHGAWGPQTRKVADAAVLACIFIAFVGGLGRALLSVRRPSWRLPPIPDAQAAQLAPYPWLIAVVGALVSAPAKINEVVDASFAAVVATHAVTALALTALIAAIVLRLGPTQARAVPDKAAPEAAGTAPARPVWVGLLLSAVLVLVVAIWVLTAVGYVALASLLAGQLTWAGIVAVAFYVLFKFADDVFTALVSSKSRFGARLQQSFGFAPQTLDQAAVLLSGLSRLALFFLMLFELVAPLGTGPGELFQRTSQMTEGFKVGEFELVPRAIFRALAVATVGFVALHVFKRWLERRYLPSTTLEPGMQSSITTLLNYAGGILVVAFALSALGIGVNRIAWVASALSVGIGFGLQAIVQNFISGLILLAEQPVKVGDWVVLGGTEGDVRRINVRATEIQLGDRSTLIVPNSEFITKTVRNMTLANAEGRVLIRLPMPLTTDAQQVRELMLAACREHPGVLETPAPSLTLEGIENGLLIFQAIAYVASPRLAGGVRSDLLFTMLDKLKQAALPLATPMVVATAPAAPAV